MIVKADQPDHPPIDLEAMPPWRVTSERYLELISSGKLGPEDKVELINSMITSMSPAGPKHNAVVRRLTRLFGSVLDRHDLQVQGTVHLSNGQIFDPDITVIRLQNDEVLEDRHPGPGDIMLIVEAAGSSMKRDAQVKMPVYAAAGIPEYWIADIENQTLIVHRDPTDHGYALIQQFKGDTPVVADAVEGLSLAPAAIFA
ncbi:MAG: Uma2 family endonuclease [Planctomycetota bacterium]